MRYFTSLFIGLMLVGFATVANAAPTARDYSGPGWKQWRITFGTDTDESRSMDVDGMCDVRVSHSGTGTVELWAVPTAATAATSGTQLGVDWTESTEAAFTFKPGTLSVKAIASVASDGTVMVIHCTPSQVGSNNDGMTFADVFASGALGNISLEAATGLKVIQYINNFSSLDDDPDTQADVAAWDISANAGVVSLGPTVGNPIVHWDGSGDVVGDGTIYQLNNNALTSNFGVSGTAAEGEFFILFNLISESPEHMTWFYGLSMHNLIDPIFDATSSLTPDGTDWLGFYHSTDDVLPGSPGGNAGTFYFNYATTTSGAGTAVACTFTEDNQANVLVLRLKGQNYWAYCSTSSTDLVPKLMASGTLPNSFFTAVMPTWAAKRTSTGGSFAGWIQRIVVIKQHDML